MRMQIRMTIYASIIYLLILASALLYQYYLLPPYAIAPGQQPSAQAVQLQQAGPHLIYVLAAELAILLLFSWLEKKYKVLSKFFTYVFREWLYTKKKALAASLLLLGMAAIILIMALALQQKYAPIVSIEITAAAVVFIIGLLLGISTMLSLLPKRFRYALLAVAYGFLPFMVLLQYSSLNGYLFPAMALAAAFIIILYAYATMFSKSLLNALAVSVAMGFALVFGLTLIPLYAFIFFFILSVYDYIAVFITKHMQQLAKTAFEARLPAFIIIGDASYIAKKLKGAKPRKGRGMLLGGGDLMIPGAVIASLVFAGWPQYAALALGGAVIGTTLNMVLLQTKLFKSGIPALPMLFAAMGLLLLASFTAVL